MSSAEAALSFTFTEVLASGERRIRSRPIAAEVPIALEVNGFGYAVLMATPLDLEDLATGFALADRLVDHARDIATIASHDSAGGIIVRLTIASHLADRIGERLRPRLSDSSCGLCGLENIEQVMRPLPAIKNQSLATPEAIFRARAALSDHQPLNAATGALHAAAVVSAEGQIRLVREDVGRHNAFDKLIGAMAREGLGWDAGFALLSSRCSYELVEKAVLAQCPLLATISAPSSLALTRARSAGLRLAVLARDDSFLAFEPKP